MSSPSPVETFDSLLKQSKFIFAVCKSVPGAAPQHRLVVPRSAPCNRQLLTGLPALSPVYRGHWCPYCMGYLRAFASLTQPIVTAGGTPVIITAEEESHLAATRTATGYTGDAIVDPQNLLAAELKARDLLDVAISKKAGYPHGMAQPAVLVMRPDGSVLQQWAIVPGLVGYLPLPAFLFYFADQKLIVPTRIDEFRWCQRQTLCSIRSGRMCRGSSRARR